MQALELQSNALPTELRPSRSLMVYYALSSLLAGPFFPIPLAVFWFRYRTLGYRIAEDGISMRWGALWRREVSLNYGRIQDIHLSSNVVERWLGLGKIQIQTASASAKAEMTLEGLPDLRALRDFLYERMRGAREASAGASSDARPLGPTRSGTPEPGADAELARLLREVTQELRAVRQTLEASRGSVTVPDGLKGPDGSEGPDESDGPGG